MINIESWTPKASKKIMKLSNEACTFKFDGVGDDMT